MKSHLAHGLLQQSRRKYSFFSSSAKAAGGFKQLHNNLCMSFWMATEGIVFLYCSCNCAKNPNFANCRFSFRKLQIFISQTTDFHFANYRFSFRKLQILISQTTDFHFVSFHFVSFRFVLQTTISHMEVLYSYHSSVVSCSPITSMS